MSHHVCDRKIRLVREVAVAKQASAVKRRVVGRGRPAEVQICEHQLL